MVVTSISFLRMPFVLVRNAVGDAMIVDAECCTGSTLGETTRVYSDSMQSGPHYDALMVDSGTLEEMRRKEISTRGLSNDDVRATLANGRRMRKGRVSYYIGMHRSENTIKIKYHNSWFNYVQLFEEE